MSPRRRAHGFFVGQARDREMGARARPEKALPFRSDGRELVVGRGFEVEALQSLQAQLRPGLAAKARALMVAAQNAA